MGYNRHNVYESVQPISLDRALAIAPTIAATEAHAERSERYGFVSTMDILEQLMAEGMTIHGVTTATIRDKSKAGFEKHLLRLRHPNTVRIDGVALDLLLQNSHDGTTCYEVQHGAFRFACANGLVSGESYMSAKIKHSRHAAEEIVDASFEVLDDMTRLSDSIKRMRQIELTRDEKEVFAHAAMTLRHEDKAENEWPHHFTRLLEARRYDDKADDLFTVYNVVQENAVRGGIRGATIGSNGRRRRTKTREINNIGRNVQLNAALQTLAEKMADLKEAA